MRYGDLTFHEISERANQGWLAVVPTGCTEQQGPHLPVDFDTWLAEQVALAAAKKASEEYGLGALVLPTIPFGPTPEHRNYGSGYIDIPAELQESLVHSVLVSLTEQGFSQIVIWRGCGGHDLSAMVKRFNETQREAKAFLPPLPYHDIWTLLVGSFVPGGHADSFATSIALYLRPRDVRSNRIPAPDARSYVVDWADPSLDFARYSSTGVIGDPTRASAELGAKVWAAIVEDVARTFHAIAQVRS